MRPGLGEQEHNIKQRQRARSVQNVNNLFAMYSELFTSEANLQGEPKAKIINKLSKPYGKRNKQNDIC